MNKITAFLLIIITTLSFTFGATMQSKAQNKDQNKTQTKSFLDVVPFVTNNDRVGFFDQKTGRIYIYDNNVSQCLYIGQIQDLGQPIQTFTTNNMNTSNPSAL